VLSLAHNTGLGGWNRQYWWIPWWWNLTAVVCIAVVAAGCWMRQLVCVTLAATALLLVAAHYAAGVLYPLDRTGIYLLPLVGLAIAGVSARFRAVGLFGALLAIECVMQVQWRSFYVWRFDADDRAIMQSVPHGEHVKLGVSWPLEPSLNYYRETRRLSWIEPVTRDGPDGEFDYYVLAEAEQDRIARYGLRVIYRGAESGTVLAERAK
jgi:hypothetical protein